MPRFRATFRQLEVFLAVAEEGSFTAASARLNISQAAISRQMFALERKLNCKLFERHNGKPAALTEQGQQLLSRAPALVEQATEVAEQWQQPPATSPRSSTRRVRVASGDIIQEHIFQPRMPDFHKRHPDIQVEFIEMPPVMESVTQMSRLHIDLAYFTFGQDTEIAGGERISMIDHGLFISPQHPLASVWRPQSSDSLPLLMYLSGSALERNVHQTLHSCGVTNYRIVARAQRAETLIQLALAGVGACWTMSHLVSEYIKQERLLDLNVHPEKLCRYRFRLPAGSSVEHVDTVDQFLTSLMVAGTPAAHT